MPLASQVGQTTPSVRHAPGSVPTESLDEIILPSFGLFEQSEQVFSNST